MFPLSIGAAGNKSIFCNIAQIQNGFKCQPNEMLCYIYIATFIYVFFSILNSAKMLKFT